MSSKRRLLGALTATALFLAPLSGTARGPSRTGSPGTVVLLHGLGRSTGSMTRLERELAARGFAVHNVGYPSRSATLEELAEALGVEVERCCATPGVPVHFVTHSMGGIVLRAFLETHHPENLGRVVMLAPPNAGSEWVDALRDSPLFRLAGPAAEQLGTDPESAPHRLGPVDFELGVIAGSRSYNPLGSWLIPGADDGTVGVASARVEGMRDFRVVDTSHTWIVRDREVLEDTIHFLETGAFRGEE